MLIKNYEANEWRNILIGFGGFITGLGILFHLFVFGTLSDNKLIPLFLSILIGSICGMVIGTFLVPFVSQYVFRKMMQIILFMASVIIGTTGTFFSLYAMISATVISIMFGSYLYCSSKDSEKKKQKEKTKPELAKADSQISVTSEVEDIVPDITAKTAKTLLEDEISEVSDIVRIVEYKINETENSGKREPENASKNHPKFGYE